MPDLQTLDPGRELLARRPFRFREVDYRVGDPFPWQSVDCSSRQLRRLYDARFVRHDADEGETMPPTGFRVLKPLSFNGRTFERGDPFPWQELGCSQRRIRQLVDNRRVGFVADDQPTIEATGRGWYAVTWRGTTERIRGEEKAAAYARQLVEAPNGEQPGEHL